MNKKVITGILLTILALGLGYSIYEFFFVSFPRGILGISYFLTRRREQGLRIQNGSL